MAYSKLSASDLEGMREVGRLAAATLLHVARHLRAGMTTDEIDRLVHEYTLEHGARPAPLDYKGFPRSVCTSINDVICHGIPGDEALRDGDIVNVDVTSVLPPDGGWHGDTSATFYIGEPGPLARHVTEVARECLYLGIDQVRPGNRVGDIGAAIQAHARAKGCSVVREYTGHGIGRQFHMEPSIPHYGRAGTGPKLVEGMAFTVEPMINAGRAAIKHLDDGWTVKTRDGSLSAQFEHTLVVTADGCEVLTRRDEILPHSEDVPWARLPSRD